MKMVKYKDTRRSIVSLSHVRQFRLTHSPTECKRQCQRRQPANINRNKREKMGECNIARTMAFHTMHHYFRCNLIQVNSHRHTRIATREMKECKYLSHVHQKKNNNNFEHELNEMCFINAKFPSFWLGLHTKHNCTRINNNNKQKQTTLSVQLPLLFIFC